MSATMNLLDMVNGKVIWAGGPGSGRRPYGKRIKQRSPVVSTKYSIHGLNKIHKWNADYEEYGVNMGAKFFVTSSGKLKLASDNEHQYTAEMMGYNTDKNNWRSNVVNDGHIMGTIVGKDIVLEGAAQRGSVGKMLTLLTEYPSQSASLRVVNAKGKSLLDFHGDRMAGIRKLTELKNTL